MERVDLEERIADLLIDLAHHALVIDAPAFATVAGGMWAGLDFANYSGRLSLDGDRLTLYLDVPPGELLGPLYQARTVRGQPSTVRLADASEADAKLTRLARLGDRAEIHLHHWTWRSAAHAELWVGRLEGHLPDFGNLALVERGPRWVKSGRDGFRLDGRYTWYLVPKGCEGADYSVVLDSRGTAIDRQDVLRDLFCMEFVFGGPLRLDPLIGIDAHRRPVAAIGVERLARTRGKHRAPVPDYIGQADAWVPVLFRCVSGKIHEEGLEPLIIAIAAYLDSVVDHIDGGYLKAQVGLEALAKRLVGGGRPELLVHDEAVWKEWVGSLRPTIRGHLRDPEKLEAVYGKLVSAMFAPTGALVARALGARGLVLPEDVLAEVKKRNYPVHGFLMNASLDHDIDGDVRRLEIVQTLIAALVAGHVGYGGPLKGYDVDEGGHRPSPSWWPVTISGEETVVQFMGERSSDGPSEMAVDVATRAYRLQGSLLPGADAVEAATEALCIFEDAKDEVRARWLTLELTGYAAHLDATSSISQVLDVPPRDRLAAHVSAYRRQTGTRRDGGVIGHFFVESLAELADARRRAKSASGTQLELSFGAEASSNDYPTEATFPRDVFDRVLDGFLAALDLQLGAVGRP